MTLKSLFGALLLAMASIGAGASAANATIISKTYAFSVETNGPISVHSGQFSYDYDTELNVYTLTSFDFALEGYIFTLDEVGIITFSDRILFGATIAGPVAVAQGVYDFWLVYRSTPQMNDFHYSVAGGSGSWGGIPTFTEIVDPVGVSEPASLGLIGAGLAGIALAATRRRKAAA